MAVNIDFDISEIESGIKRLTAKMKEFNRKALFAVANEVLRLSTFQVPHDTGLLQASGKAEENLGAEDFYEVGYNKVYAARLHEHPEYRFQKGRKGKYLEDPIKHNLTHLRTFYGNAAKGAFV